MAYPDRGAGNDPNFGRRGGGGGGVEEEVVFSPPRLNIFTVGNMGVMICLGQGGLRNQQFNTTVDHQHSDGLLVKTSVSKAWNI